MANPENIKFRLGVNGLNRPLTYEELDSNFSELKDIIVAYNDFYDNEYTLREVYISSETSVSIDSSQTNSYVIETTQPTSITLENAPLNITKELWIRVINPVNAIWTTTIKWQKDYFFEIESSFALYHLVWIGGEWHGNVHTTG